jgi:hypothetical protein
MFTVESVAEKILFEGEVLKWSQLVIAPPHQRRECREELKYVGFIAAGPNCQKGISEEEKNPISCPQTNPIFVFAIEILEINEFGVVS